MGRGRQRPSEGLVDGEGVTRDGRGPVQVGAGHVQVQHGPAGERERWSKSLME